MTDQSQGPGLGIESPTSPSRVLEADAPKVVEKEDQEELEAEVPPAEAVGAAAGGAAGKKKKKKKNKKGGNQNNDSASIPKSDSAAISEPEVTVKEVDVPSPVKEEKKFDEAVPIAAPAELAEEKKEEAAKPTAAEAAVVAELQQKISPMKIAEQPEENKEEEKDDAPVVSAPLQPPPPAATAAPEPQQPQKEEIPVKSTSPTPEKPATSSPVVKSTLSAAMPASPAVSSKGPVIAAAKTYLADTAKAWGGADGSTAQTSATMDVKVAPGQKMFPYAELKELKGQSGIDMTSKEKYLSDEEFKKVFNKDRNAFLAQPAWRQQLQKKEVGLF